MYIYLFMFLMPRHQNAKQNRKINVVNISFRNVAKFRHLGAMITNEYLIVVEINIRLISGNACYHSVQKFIVFPSAV
jgi:hypothetical protein